MTTTDTASLRLIFRSTNVFFVEVDGFGWTLNSACCVYATRIGLHRSFCFLVFFCMLLGSCLFLLFLLVLIRLKQNIKGILSILEEIYKEIWMKNYLHRSNYDHLDSLGTRRRTNKGLSHWRLDRARSTIGHYDRVPRRAPKSSREGRRHYC